jgi:protein-tyrosine phosphatase
MWFYSVILLCNPKPKKLFHFLKLKPYLKDMIPDRHVDFHSHLLPGIDDGAKTFDDTRELITAMRKLRFEQIITTPHIMKNVWDNTAHSITAKLAETQTGLQHIGLDIPMHAAAEYLMDGNFTELFQTQQLLTVKDNYVLVEMSYINPPIQLYDILFDLQVAGYKPILAHPERYIFYHSKFSEYEKLKHAGCLFQVNLLSVIGYYGVDVAEAAKKLLRKGMIDFAGSDIHHKHHVNGFSRRLVLNEIQPLNEALANNQIFHQ